MPTARTYLQKRCKILLQKEAINNEYMQKVFHVALLGVKDTRKEKTKKKDQWCDYSDKA